MTSPLQVCLVGSNWLADGGARLHLRGMPIKPNVRHTFMGGPMEPRLDDRRQSWVRCCGSMLKMTMAKGVHG